MSEPTPPADREPVRVPDHSPVTSNAPHYVSQETQHGESPDTLPVSLSFQIRVF